MVTVLCYLIIVVCAVRIGRLWDWNSQGTAEAWCIIWDAILVVLAVYVLWSK
jgi:hypothetical protein